MNSAIAGSSFRIPLWFLAPARRRAMLALYGFCRKADDAVDEAGTPEEKAERLSVLRQYIADIYSDAQNDALADAVKHYALNRDYFDAILDGMQMDLDGKMLRPSLSTLALYCYRAAGCVGLLSVQIFGNKEAEAQGFALALGQAMQLTNILRDVNEDAARGRIYLPKEFLEKERVSDLTPEQVDITNPALKAVGLALAAQAEYGFREAHRLSRFCNRRKLLPALLMARVYQRKLHKMVGL